MSDLILVTGIFAFIMGKTHDKTEVVWIDIGLEIMVLIVLFIR